MMQNRVDLGVEESLNSDQKNSIDNYVVEKKESKNSINKIYYKRDETIKDKVYNVIENQASRFGTYKHSEVNEYSVNTGNLNSSGSSFQIIKKFDFLSLSTEKIPMNERVFWTKEKMDYIRIKFKMAKEKIKKKTEFDFSELYLHIKEGNREKIL